MTGHADVSCRACIADSSSRTDSVGSLLGSDADSKRLCAFLSAVFKAEPLDEVVENRSSGVSVPLEHFEHWQSKKYRFDNSF